MNVKTLMLLLGLVLAFSLNACESAAASSKQSERMYNDYGNKQEFCLEKFSGDLYEICIHDHAKRATKTYKASYLKKPLVVEVL